MDAVECRIQTPDGRTLTVYEAGDRGGAPILFHHGTPSSGAPYAPHVRLAEARGARLVSFDRAGYGSSTRLAGRAIVDVAADAEAIADALGLERFVTWGLSGGGPHALATAARLRDRVTAVATMASVAPADAADLDFLAGMGEGNIEEFGLARQGEEALRPLHVASAEELVRLDVPQLVETMQPFLSEVDSAALSGELGVHLRDSFRGAFTRGVDGWVDDDLAFTWPWGFELAEIAVPALVVQGRRDLMVPYDHGAWLARNVPGAEAWLSETEGHLTLFETATPDVYDWLLGRL